MAMSTSTTTYWTNEMILELIKLYEKQECLWNPSHEDHKCRSTINKAYNEISIALGTHAAEVRRKMKNLVSQFNREYKNLQHANRNKSIDREKKAKWFAYEPLHFLLKRNKPNLHEGQENSDLDISFSEYDTDSHDFVPENIETPKFEIINIKSEIPDETGEKEKESSSEHITSSTSYQVVKENYSPLPENPKKSPSSIRHPRVTRIIRKRRNDEEERKELLRKICRDKNRDECDIFGELVTCKLRRLNSFARNKVEHLISTILWEASLGKFDHPQNQNESSDHTIHVENINALKKYT